MRLSKRGAAFIAGWEAIYLYAYPDPGTGGEPWTIGIGATVHDGQGRVQKGQRITLERAIIRFRETMENRYGPDVVKAIQRNLAQHELEALLSFHQNTGAILRGSVDDKFNRGYDVLAFATWRAYRNAGGRVLQGLVRRREAEIRLYRTGDYGSRAIVLRTAPDAAPRTLAPADLPWDIAGSSSELTADFPPIASPLPTKSDKGNFLLDLIRYLWSKVK